MIELTEDKIGKLMKSVCKITEHAECLREVFEELTDGYGERRHHKHYDDDDVYGSRYGMRRGRGY